MQQHPDVTNATQLHLGEQLHKFACKPQSHVALLAARVSCPKHVCRWTPAAVSHAGLEGHGNYYEEKPLMFYAMKNATLKCEEA